MARRAERDETQRMTTSKELYEFLNRTLGREEPPAAQLPRRKANSAVVATKSLRKLHGRFFTYYEEIPRPAIPVDYTGIEGSNSHFQYRGGCNQRADRQGRSAFDIFVRRYSCYCSPCRAAEEGDAGENCRSRAVAGDSVMLHRLEVTKVTTSAEQRASARTARKERTAALLGALEVGQVVAVEGAGEDDRGEGEEGEPFWLAKVVQVPYVVEERITTAVATHPVGSVVFRVQWLERTAVVEEGWKYKLVALNDLISTQSVVICATGHSVDLVVQPRNRFLLARAVLEEILATEW